MRYQSEWPSQQSPTRNAGAGIERRETSALFLEFKLLHPLRRTILRFFYKTKRSTLGQAIPCLGIEPEKTKILKDTGTHVITG